MKVGVLGAWSIDNPGDAMIGWATRLALRARLPHAEVIAFAPRLPGASWGHDFSATRGIDGVIVPVPVDDFTWARDLDALVVGGGGIIIPDQGFSAFLLSDHWDGPAAWNAVCSQGTTAASLDAHGLRRVRRCCEQLAYVSVRNRTTATFLRRCGFDGPVHVVPDPAFEDVPLPPEDKLPGFPIGLSLGGSFLGPRAAPFYDALIDALSQLVHGPRHATLYLLPFGSVYGDERAQLAAAGRLPDCRVLRPQGPLEAWRAIGRMRLHIAARLHAIIAACTQGVAFLAIDEYASASIESSKIRDMLSDGDLDAYGVTPTMPADFGPALARALALADSDGRLFDDLRTRARARLDAHWGALLHAVGLPAQGRGQCDGQDSGIR